eukprot:4617558-Alexandrium_andersonii.AAC.1
MNRRPTPAPTGHLATPRARTLTPPKRDTPIQPQGALCAQWRRHWDAPRVFTGKGAGGFAIPWPGWAYAT